jgi:hypothetical protein
MDQLVALRSMMRGASRVACKLVVTTLLVTGVFSAATAGASSLSTVTFTGTAPTSLVANTASTWTIGFTTSSSGTLRSGSTITVTFPAGFTTSTTSPTVSLLTPTGSGQFATDCKGTGSDSSEGNVVVITLSSASGYTCSPFNALGSSTAATLNVGVVNGNAGTYGATNFSVATSADTTAVSPSAGATVTATSVSAVTVTGTAPTSLVKSAASTWTWGFTTSSSGALSAGDYVTLTFPSTYSAITTTPTVVLESPSSFATNCIATASDANEANVIVVTLANNGGSTCALADSTAATLSVALTNGTTDVLTTFSLSTDQDTAAVSPTGTAPTMTAATKTTAVSFTTTAPTSLVANDNSVWTVNFSTSSAGALANGSYIQASFPTTFSTSTTNPAIVLKSPAAFVTDCAATGVDQAGSNVVVVTLANNGANTCTLAKSTAASLTIAVVNGLAGTYGDTTYSLDTSSDGTSVSPTSGSETVTSAVPGSGTMWSVGAPTSPGEASAAGPPSSPTSPQGGFGTFMCASTSSEVVDLSWTGVSNATSYVILQATTASGTYSVASPTPVYSGTTATITYTTAVTEYYEVEAVIGSAWVSTPSGVATNGAVSPGYVVTATSSPKCTNN